MPVAEIGMAHLSEARMSDPTTSSFESQALASRISATTHAVLMRQRTAEVLEAGGLSLAWDDPRRSAIAAVLTRIDLHARLDAVRYAATKAEHPFLP